MSAREDCWVSMAATRKVKDSSLGASVAQPKPWKEIL